MANPMRIRATEKDGVVEVKVLMRHIMETGLRKDKAGKPIPGHYIETVTATVGSQTVFTALLGPAVSKDPYLNFKLKSPVKKGDKLVVAWQDNKGEKDSKSTVIK